jgi:hypothetical protein
MNRVWIIFKQHNGLQDNGDWTGCELYLYSAMTYSTVVTEQGVSYTYTVQWPWSDNRNISIRYQQLYETKED